MDNRFERPQNVYNINELNNRFGLAPINLNLVNNVRIEIDYEDVNIRRRERWNFGNVDPENFIDMDDNDGRQESNQVPRVRRHSDN